MGACLSGGSKGDYIPDNDGGEEEFHNRFLEDKALGEGQFGVVKMVHDMKANQGQGEAMACKALRKGITFKDNTIFAPLKPEVLKTECDILRTLAGEHYCLRLTGIYESPRMIYVVTELCSGGEMMEYVAKQDQLRTEDVSRIAFQLLDAVNHCATHGVIHRDIKPENIMFKDESAGAELRLIDFGSGAIDKDQELARHTTFAGSAFYISPELFQRTYTSRTDVWSCGVTLYVLAAGYPAESLQKAFNILQKSKNRDLRTLPGMPEDMPDSFIDLLDQLVCYRYKMRKSAGDLLQHEFVQFHVKHQEAGISIEDVVAAAAMSEAEQLNDSTGRRIRPTQSIRLTESVKRHSVFLNYQQFERQVTTLLATLLNRQDLEEFFKSLDSALGDDTEKGSETVGSKATDKPTKLQVIEVSKLKKILNDLNQDKCLATIDKLPNAILYDNFAYHIALLKEFDRITDGNTGSSQSGKLRRSNSIGGPVRRRLSGKGAGANTVQGSSAFSSFLQTKKEVVAFRPANSAEGLTSSARSY